MIKSRKFSIIMDLSKNYPVIQFCKFAKVSKSEYYKWKKQFKSFSKREIENFEVNANLKALHKEYNGIYGKLRLTACLNKILPFKVNHKRVYRLMKKLDIKSVIRKKRYSRKFIEGKKAKNVLDRKFQSERPLQKLCMDTTYIPMSKGNFMFLNAVTDVFNNEIVAYVISKRNDVEMVNDTLKELYKLNLPENCLLHTDQGFQFTREAYSEELKLNNIIQSMSRRGNCWDNAPIESFFSHFKTESLELKSKSLTPEKIIEITENYIKFYNEKRIQLKLSSLNPIEYRTQTA